MRTVSTCLRVAALSAVLMTAGSAYGQVNRTWNGGGGNGNWSVNANWGGTAPSSSGDNLFFGGSNQTSTTNDFVDLPAPIGVNSITFNADAGAFTLGGYKIRLFENIVVKPGGGSVTHTINLGIVWQNSRAITTTTQGSIVINGVIGQSRTGVGVTKNGAGTLTLSNLNTFDGRVLIDEGTVSVNTLANAGVDSSLGRGNLDAVYLYSVIRLGQGYNTGTLTYTGTGNTTDRQISIGDGAGTGGATINNNGSGALIFSNANFNVRDFSSGSQNDTRMLTLGGSYTGNNEIQGVIANNVFTGMFAPTKTIALVKQDAGKWILSGINTYTGGTTVNGGTLLVTKAAALPGYGDAGKVTVNSGGTLAVRAGGTGEWNSTEINTLLGTNAFKGGSKLGIDVSQDKNFTYGTDIGTTQPNKGFVKSGQGKLTLTANNTYTGATNVNEGTLLINGNNSAATGDVIVAAGATLGGSGTIGGATTISGTLSPGESPGILKFSKSVTFDSTGTALMDIEGTAGAGFVGGHDQIMLTGTGSEGVLTYDGTLVLNFATTIDAVGSYEWDLFKFASDSGAWDLVTLAGKYSGDLLDADTNGVWDLKSGLNNWQFTESSGVLSLTVVPEPSTLTLLVVAGVVGCGFRMRRHVRRSRKQLPST